jgi:outer membrane protein assembly factor BamA
MPDYSIAQGLPAGRGRIEGKFQFVPVPYINYNRSIGFTLGALPMAMWNPVDSDTISPSSVMGGLGMYTTNKSWFVMGFGAFFFDEDNWRVMLAGGTGSINYQFYLEPPINSWIPYNTAADFFYIQAQKRVINKIYAGISYIYMKFNTATDELPLSETAQLKGLGINITLDTRLNFYYPREGYNTNIKYQTFPEGLGNEFVSNKIEIDHNHYFPFRNNQDILAARVYAGLGIGDLAFNQQFVVGRRDIRGYTQGAHRGNYLLAVQSEYRWNFYERWSAAGFLGLATIFEAINESDEGKILPGIGAGLRWTAFTDNHMNVGIDIAFGYKDWGIYFRVGEAF